MLFQHIPNETLNVFLFRFQRLLLLDADQSRLTSDSWVVVIVSSEVLPFNNEVVFEGFLSSVLPAILGK
jgi:hypothetical protein